MEWIEDVREAMSEAVPEIHTTNFILLKIIHSFDVRPYNDIIRFYNDIIVIIKFPSCNWITAAHDTFYSRFKVKMFC